ncbi:MAG TPA: TolC family protein [Mariprofundaceae bacterium]|nr:TolC family protein [Mariprofundaceae bacterium]
MTLNDVVEIALCNNPQTRASWAAARIQAARLGSSKSAYLPTLSLQGSLSRNASQAAGVKSSSNQAQGSLSASYLLFDFGGRRANLENAEELLIAANATDDATVQTVFLNAVQAYYNLLSAQASVEANRIAEASAQESLAAAEARYAAGAATPADRLQARTALSQATLNRIRSEGDERNAMGSLANVMSIALTQPLQLAPAAKMPPDLVVEKDIGRLITLARERRPDLQAADAQIKAGQASVAAAKASGMPQLSLDATATASRASATAGSSNSRNGSIGLTVTVPLFTGFNTTYQVRAAEAQLENSIASRDQLANQIALQVWQAYQTMQTNSQALRTADDLVASAEASERVSLGRYKAGVGNILDVLTAQSALASARQQQVTARYNWNTARFALAQAIGLLDLTALRATGGTDQNSVGQ